MADCAECYQTFVPGTLLVNQKMPHGPAVEPIAVAIQCFLKRLMTEGKVARTLSA